MRVISENGTLTCMQLNESQISAISGDRLEILKTLARQPMYAAEMARKLGIDKQALYYHIKILQKAGLIKIGEYEEKYGAMAKKYVLVSDSVAIILKNDRWRSFNAGKTSIPPLFRSFVDNESFNGKFIVGSPDPHGRYRARASEFPILELAMLLGSYATFSFPLYILDTQLKENDRKQNLIVAGGPKVNLLSADLNMGLPLRFERDTFEIYSRFSKKRYTGDIGVIELIENPFSKGKKIIFIAGLNHHGTRAAVLSIISKMKEIEKGNTFSPRTIAKVVEGFDENGDGIVDAVEILE